MQSHDYVPGVSGWKIDENGRLELNDGNRRVIAKMLMVTTAGPGMTNDEAQASITESLREEAAARSDADESLTTHIGAFRCNVGLEAPFAVDGYQVILSQAIVDAGKFSQSWGVRMKDTVAGKRVLSGFGLGLDCMCKGGYIGTPVGKEENSVSKLEISVDASKVLDQLRAKISETKLSESLSAKIDQIPYRSETQLSDRIKTLEACVVQLNSELGRLVVAISSLVSESAKK